MLVLCLPRIAASASWPHLSGRAIATIADTAPIYLSQVLNDEREDVNE